MSPNKKKSRVSFIFATEFFKRTRLIDDFHINITNIDYWEWVCQRYSDFCDSIEAKEVVPKTIHQIWIGKGAPKRYDKWRASWLIKNPNFNYILWDEQSILDLKLTNERQFLCASNPGVKADIARYEILYRYGGVYADTDFEAFRPIPNKLLTCSFIAGQLFSYSPEAANGLIIAAPGSALLEDVIAQLPDYPGHMNSMQVLDYCGNFYLTRMIWEKRDDISDMIILPSQYFYPWPNFLTRQSGDPYSYVSEDSIAIHHWEMSWMKKRPLFARIFKKLMSMSFR